MRILLTGAAGFIGSHVAEALLGRGDEVVGFDNFDPYYDPALKEANVAALSRWPGWFLVRGDVRHRGEVRRALGLDAFDAVLHLAARAGVRPSIEDPESYADVNVRGTTLVVEQGRLAGVRRFVVASSSSVYGDAAEGPLVEDARADAPVSPYAASKRAAELACASLAHVHGLSIRSLRYFTVYGPRQRPDMAIQKFIAALEEGRPIQRFGDGTSRRDYTYVADAVAGTLAALAAADPARPGHRAYNVGESRTLSLAELIAAVERAVGRRAEVEALPAQAGDVRFTHADLARSHAELGYRPATTLEDGLRLQVEWHRATRGARPAAP